RDAGWNGNHGLGWYGYIENVIDKKFAEVNVDGPVLYGYRGGALGSNHQGTKNIALRWTENGTVGIGTNDPQDKLQIDNGGILLTNTPTTLWNSWKVGFQTPRGTAWVTELDHPDGYYYGFGQTNGGWYWMYNKSDNSDGDFAMKLSKCGQLEVGDVTVVMKDWCDYVFEPEYKLLSFEELEQYISTQKHLPGIPTETDVLQNGVKVGEMSALLLKKIEELTLYLIQLKKEIEEMKKEIKSLKN
ncbi:MAG: hypothetical protein KKD31_01845, partial [Bacteroidetes bacterium]|nr:hypothetical protein [Bacteroidota bacterium]